MTGRRIRAVHGSDGQVRAVRLHLAPHESGEVARTDPAEPGMRVDFDRDGRPLALEVAVDRPVRLDRVDRMLEALGRPTLDGGERAALSDAG